MAQTEDTELRDLVIEALEKNGSLAKIRALLRANIFLVFEDECENLKQNVSLDNILKLPEGVLCLSIVHEFLEFCNLKNTLFVYTAESRQKKEYVYEGQKKLAEKLNLPKNDNVKEPILITLLKHMVRPNQRKHLDQINAHNLKIRERSDENTYKDDQNCTYIVHEDSCSSATSNSQSDNSSDEKNKLHLQLHLDNSDTDTSSDSTRDKSCSEYIPNEHIVDVPRKTDEDSFLPRPSAEVKHQNNCNNYDHTQISSNYLQKLVTTNSSSDSTSYIEVKPYNSLDEKLLNTTGVPIVETTEMATNLDIKTKSLSNSQKDENILQTNASKLDSVSSETLSSASLRNEEDVGGKPKSGKTSIEESGKSEVETAEYSNDFTPSPVTRYKNVADKPPFSPESIQEELGTKSQKNSSFESQHHSSQSSQSSISISDVADLISEKSSSFGQHAKNENDSLENKNKSSSHSKKISVNDKSKLSDDSAEFSESPVPSLSNLSLDIHSD